jgi:sulfur-oxidizing protein SoxX
MVRQHHSRRLCLSPCWGLSGDARLWLCLLTLPLQLMTMAALGIVLTPDGTAHGADGLVPYRIVDGAIPTPLTAHPGDPERGRRAVLDRDAGDCTICHAMPLPQREFHGTIGPPLDGIARRTTAGVLRLRLVDPQALHPATIMPAYYKLQGLHRVLERYRDTPVLSAQQIEDIIAYLLTLTD